eukprot:2275583-Pleurochrysis_carterae.AAC.6
MRQTASSGMQSLSQMHAGTRTSVRLNPAQALELQFCASCPCADLQKFTKVCAEIWARAITYTSVC